MSVNVYNPLTEQLTKIADVGGSGGSGSGGMTLLASGDITTSDIDQGYLGFVETIDSTNCDMIALLLKVNGNPIFNAPTPILSANMSYSGAPAISYDVNVGSQNRTLGIYYDGNHANLFAVDLSGFSIGDSCRFEYEIYGLSTGSSGGSGGGSNPLELEVGENVIGHIGNAELICKVMYQAQGARLQGQQYINASDFTTFPDAVFSLQRTYQDGSNSWIYGETLKASISSDRSYLTFDVPAYQTFTNEYLLITYLHTPT